MRKHHWLREKEGLGTVWTCTRCGAVTTGPVSEDPKLAGRVLPDCDEEIARKVLES